MPDKWVTLAEAAAGMKVHPRTVERQIKSGKLQSRRADGGQLEVLVDLPEPPTAEESALSVVAGQAENQVQLALGATSALVKSAQEDARLARVDADRAWDEALTARRGAKVAWCVVGSMALAVVVAVGWSATTMTRSQVELKHASEQVRQVNDSVGQLVMERDALRNHLAAAEEARARAQGELSGRVAADQETLALALKKQQAETTALLTAERERVRGSAQPTTKPTTQGATPAVVGKMPTTQPTSKGESLVNTSGSDEDR